MMGATFAVQRTRRSKGLLGLPFSNRLIYHRPFNSLIQSRKSSIRLPSDQRMHGCDGDGESNQQNLVMCFGPTGDAEALQKALVDLRWAAPGTAKQCIVDGMRSLAQRPEASGTLRSNHCRSGRDLMAASRVS